MTKLFTRIVAFAALALALSGCIFFESPRERAMRKDPNFQAGYSDGCATANARGTDYREGGQVRDDQLFATSKPYRAGWSAGYSACNNQLNPNLSPDINGMPDQRRNP
ncbi:MAG: hypothetical protein JSR60_14410 [Proteobacteria bacterium]|nr:hypothetical protein [Pseudomonadota bacterium]